MPSMQACLLYTSGSVGLKGDFTNAFDGGPEAEAASVEPLVERLKAGAVSYTHLDVYKRQMWFCAHYCGAI